MMTTGRRSAPVPQLTCVGGDCSFEPDVVQCRNVGTDSYGEVQWACTAQLPNEFDLGTTDVVCEGFNSRDDPFILAGSCGLEYTMHRRGATFSSYGAHPYRSARDSDSFLSKIVRFVMMGSVAMLMYYIFMAPTQPSSHDRRRGNGGGGYDGWGGGGGGGGWGGWGSGFGGYDNSCEPRGSRGTSGPGFWSGLGLGALGASMARGFGSNRRGYGTHSYNRYGGGGGYGGGSSSWGGGPSSGSGSGGGHSSSGFGGTRRR
ncbi:Store-operated calcium entry-associated regulatory factor [Hondaea fermentalgiana]|uniref:Store-operated calcium entry-associated regulatory factor n=1 Tax=Hondaea fermentalgiana TaxID=2315210 RepID=A0A2R5G570_9STRA|nr:Store-operated calcium entry-associated regulatory factor [Hondaea fermentalgiana]|eukprot:GBG26182.1 Store-operated calcium entry-associated regulatory factor [Hondaea fermentalgiana]